jgi:hypothetical protein
MFGPARPTINMSASQIANRSRLSSSLPSCETPSRILFMLVGFRFQRNVIEKRILRRHRSIPLRTLISRTPLPCGCEIRHRCLASESAEKHVSVDRVKAGPETMTNAEMSTSLPAPSAKPIARLGGWRARRTSPCPRCRVGAEWFIRLMNRYNNAMALMA